VGKSVGVDADGPFAGSVPNGYALGQNYPNPFNPATTFSFSLGASGFATLKVFDLLGREVSSLVNEELTAGTHSVRFDARDLASGAYIYRLQAGGTVLSRKLVLVR
jgi:hypothetical protein